MEQWPVVDVAPVGLLARFKGSLSNSFLSIYTLFSNFLFPSRDLPDFYQKVGKHTETRRVALRREGCLASLEEEKGSDERAFFSMTSLFSHEDFPRSQTTIIENVSRKSDSIKRSTKLEFQSKSETSYFALREVCEFLKGRMLDLEFAFHDEFTARSSSTYLFYEKIHTSLVQYKKINLGDGDLCDVLSTKLSSYRAAIDFLGTVKLTLIVHNFVMKIGDQAA